MLSYGENHYRPSACTVFPTIHAECDAISKLPKRRRGSRLKKVDILVVRSNIGGTVGNSKPCFKCLQSLYTDLPKKGYMLDTVHYTVQGGLVESKKFTKLLDEEPHIPKYFKGL